MNTAEVSSGQGVVYRNHLLHHHRRHSRTQEKFGTSTHPRFPSVVKLVAIEAASLHELEFDWLYLTRSSSWWTPNGAQLDGCFWVCPSEAHAIEMTELQPMSLACVAVFCSLRQDGTHTTLH